MQPSRHRRRSVYLRGIVRNLGRNEHSDCAHCNAVARNRLSIAIAVDSPGQGEHQFEDLLGSRSGNSLIGILRCAQKASGLLDHRSVRIVEGCRWVGMSRGKAMGQIVPDMKAPGQRDQPFRKCPSRIERLRKRRAVEQSVVETGLNDSNQQIVSRRKIPVQRCVPHPGQDCNAIQRRENPFRLEDLTRSRKDGGTVLQGIRPWTSDFG
jgi:hypothetical protein